MSKNSILQKPFPLESLPQDCLSVVLSHCSPRDICRLSCVCSSWKQAGESEAAWSHILPWRHAVDSHFPALKAAENARAAFDLVLAGVLSSDRKFSLRADSSTGRISLHASVVDNLDISWLDKSRETGYWTTRSHVDGSSFDKCAYLIRVCWFQITGRLKSEIGLPPGKYRVSWKVGKCPTQFVWTRVPASCTVSLSNQHRVLEDVKVDLGSQGRECGHKQKPVKAAESSGSSGVSGGASDSSPSSGGSWFWGGSGTAGSSSAQQPPANQLQATAATPGPGLPPAGDVLDSFDIPWWLKPVARWGVNQVFSALENAEVVEVVTDNARPTMMNTAGTNQIVPGQAANAQPAVTRTVWRPDNERPMTGIDVLQQMLHDAQHSLTQAQAQQADNPDAERSIPALQQTLTNIQAELNTRRMAAAGRRSRSVAAGGSSRPAGSSSHVVYSTGQDGSSFQFRWSSGGSNTQVAQNQSQTPASVSQSTASNEEASGEASNPFSQLLGGIGNFFTGSSSSSSAPAFDRNGVRWEEFDVGEVVLEDQGEGLCKIDADVGLTETVSGGWKSGLYVDSFVLTQCD